MPTIPAALVVVVGYLQVRISYRRVLIAFLRVVYDCFVIRFADLVTRHVVMMFAIAIFYDCFHLLTLVFFRRVDATRPLATRGCPDSGS